MRIKTESLIIVKLDRKFQYYSKLPARYTLSMNLSRVLAFTEMLQAFQKVDRAITVPGIHGRQENDVEHSYTLGMLGWYIASTEDLGLNPDLVLKYGLIHDLVEVYAGDTYIYSTDAAHVASKQEREDAAAKQLQEEFPDFTDLHQLIETYEKREDEESRFIYALDKLQPMLHGLMDEGHRWREMGVTLAMAIENKQPKVAAHPHVAAWYEELVVILRERQEELFGNITA
jgi:putative hydrolase of HD superfamily